MAKKAVQETRSIVIPQQQLSGMLVEVEGITPLIVHRFGEKARKQLRDAHEKKATKSARPQRGAAEIASEIAACHYPVVGAEKKGPTEGRYGFPAAGFKAAAVSASPFGSGLFKSRVKSFFFVPGEVIPITCDAIDPREDAVRLANGVVQLRYRPYYLGWKAAFGVQYCSDVITREQLLNLFDLAGTMCGIGENRPGKTGGTNGQWKIVTVLEKAVGDLPRMQILIEDNDLLAQARDIARAMGAVS